MPNPVSSGSKGSELVIWFSLLCLWESLYRLGNEKCYFRCWKWGHLTHKNNQIDSDLVQSPAFVRNGAPHPTDKQDPRVSQVLLVIIVSIGKKTEVDTHNPPPWWLRRRMQTVQLCERVAEKMRWSGHEERRGSGVQLPGFEAWLCPFPARWHGQVTVSLRLTFFIWRKKLRLSTS